MAPCRTSARMLVCLSVPILISVAYLKPLERFIFIYNFICKYLYIYISVNNQLILSLAQKTMTYMLKTGYFDIYGLARFFPHSHWRAGECQSCTLYMPMYPVWDS